MTVGAFVPFLSGFYMATIVTELRKEACRRDIDLVLIMTNGFGEYHLPVALDYLDAAYFVLNSVSPELIVELEKRNIPMAANFDLCPGHAVEVVCSDQMSGIEALFDHLYNLGHREIGYIGNLDIVDMRIRLETLYKCYEKYGLTFQDHWLFEVDEPSLPGGIQAGKEFLNLEPSQHCKAMICASDQIALGFGKVLGDRGYQFPQDMAIAGIDNTSMGLKCTPSLTSVDQNLRETVKIAVERLIERVQGRSFNPIHQTVKQFLVARKSCGEQVDESLEKEISTDHSEAFLDESLMDQAHYSESLKVDADLDIMQDNYELSIAQALTGLGSDWVVHISKWWGPFLKWGCLGHWELNNKNALHPEPTDKLSIVAPFLDDDDNTVLSHDEGKIYPAGCFPPNDLEKAPIPSPALITLFPVSPEKNHWGVLTLVDELRKDMNPFRYNMFNYYLVLMSFFLHRVALSDTLSQREKSVRDVADQLEVILDASNDGIWSWDLETDRTDWNARALEMMGFSTEKDHEYYKHLPLFERIHLDDKPEVAALFYKHLKNEDSFKIQFRLQARDGEYLWVNASGKALRDDQGQATKFVGALTDVTQQIRDKEHIQYMAYHDVLTGLPNRMALTEEVSSQLIDHPERTFAIMLMDMNRFKLINDTLGHQAGDALLQHVAHSVEAHIPEGDVFYRFGGDEFVLLSHIKNDEEAMALSSHILHAIKKDFSFHGEVIEVFCSLGISFYPRDGETLQSLIRAADIAMYQAKSLQMYEAVIYQQQEHQQNPAKKTLKAGEQRFKDAIAQERLFLEYHPVFKHENSKKRVNGTMACSQVEVLVQWLDDRDFSRDPSYFIPQAERSEILASLDYWALNTAFIAWSEWSSQHLGVNSISYNINEFTYKNAQFYQTIQNLLLAHAVDGQHLFLELTEDILLANTEHTKHQLQELDGLGVNIIIDDFGRGQTSFKLLSELPIHSVKVATYLIPKDVNSPSEEEVTKLKVLESMIGLAKTFGFNIIAQGVDELDQREALKHMGFDGFQGSGASLSMTNIQLTDYFRHSHHKPSAASG